MHLQTVHKNHENIDIQYR